MTVEAPNTTASASSALRPRLDTGQERAAVVAAEAHGVGDRVAQVGQLARALGHVVQVARRVGLAGG